MRYLCNMKTYLLIIVCLLSGCYNEKETLSENILSEITFSNVLKEIHLTESAFELNKKNNVLKSEEEMFNSYFEIYKKHDISEKDFNLSLEYYTENPEKLGAIYANLLQELINERSKLDQQ